MVQRLRLLTLAGLTMLHGIAPVGAEPKSDTFGVDEYFEVQRISELAMSPDGHWLAYLATRGAVGVEKQQIYVRALSAGSLPISVPDLADGHGLVWIPVSDNLSFISSRSGAEQVYVFDPRTRKTEQLTRAQDAVSQVRFAGIANRYAYTTKKRPGAETSVYAELRNGE